MEYPIKKVQLLFTAFSLKFCHSIMAYKSNDNGIMELSEYDKIDKSYVAKLRTLFVKLAVALTFVLCNICLLSCNNDDDANIKPNPEPNTPPEAFSLIGVTQGASGVDVFPTFSWNQSIDPDNDTVTYDLYLGTTATIDANGITNILYAENISTTTFTVTERLNTYERYYWRVVAKDGNGGSISSVPYHFDTRGLNFATSVNASASFAGRSRHTSVMFEGKLWVIGGYDSATNSASNDVWISYDNSNWYQFYQTIGFTARLSHTTVVFDNKLWVIGGISGNTDTNDVWYSVDGSSWNNLAQANPFPIRSDHTTVVFNNKIWVIAGKRGGFVKNDVWWSEDGSTWNQATAAAPFPARSNHTSVVFDDRIWVIGGSDGQGKNDVWFSTDGSSWAQASPSAKFSSRLSHTSVVFDDKMWVIGGTDSNYKNDLWYSADGVNWTQATSNAPFVPRISHSSTVFDDKIWVIAGRDQNSVYRNDVWAFD